MHRFCCPTLFSFTSSLQYLHPVINHSKIITSIYLTNSFFLNICLFINVFIILIFTLTNSNKNQLVTKETIHTFCPFIVIVLCQCFIVYNVTREIKSKTFIFLLDLISFIFLLSFLSLKLQYFFYFRT
jgi:sRNA-binding regulator protein Hfq